MKRMLLKAILVAMTISYTPQPAPVVQPGDPFVFDPAQCPSPAIGALVIPAGALYTGNLTVIEPDGDEPAVFTASKISIDATPYSSAKDPNDTDFGMAKIHRYHWQWAPTQADKGINYININVRNPTGLSNTENDRTLVILVKDNQPPIFGCIR